MLKQLIKISKCMKYLLKLYKRIQEKIWEWEFTRGARLKERAKEIQEMEIKLAEMKRTNLAIRRVLEKQGYDLSELD